MHGSTPQKSLAGAGPVDGGHPALAEVVAEGQSERDRQDQSLAYMGCIHFGQQIRDRLGRSSRAPPCELRESPLAQLPQVVLAEVRIDVDIQIEVAAGLLRVAIQQVLHALRARLQVDLRCQE